MLDAIALGELLIDFATVGKVSPCLGPQGVIRSQEIQHSEAAVVRFSQVQFLCLKTLPVLIGLKNYRGIILSVVEM